MHEIINKQRKTENGFKLMKQNFYIAVSDIIKIRLRT